MRSRADTSRMPHRRSRQRGAAAVEAALVMFMLTTLLTFPVFFARVLWHYTVAQKAAQDAARYLSTVSASEMRSPLLAQEAAKVAAKIATDELAELTPGKPIQAPAINCGSFRCGTQAGVVPDTVRVMVTFGMFDTFFGVIDTGRYGWTLTADVSYNYAGT